MQTNNFKIGSGQPCYIIAEIGHNHQGEQDLALEMVRIAAENGANAVKFQKRSNKDLFIRSYYDSEYKNPNSFGNTYGEHREFLEPDLETLIKIDALTKELKIDFIMTVFDIESFEFCERNLSVDAYKIQSSDLTYLDLIEKVINSGKPYFISCGASALKEIEETFQLCTKGKTEFCMMYAVSAYPAKNEQLNLKRILQLKDILKFDNIGYSCHSPENKAAEYARICGAVAIEKHFTLDRSQKGPDHAFSSTPENLNELRRSLSEIDILAGRNYGNDQEIDDYQIQARFKMGKCAVARNTIESGSKLTPEDIAYKSPASGINPMEIRKYFGRMVRVKIEKDTVISPDDLI